MFKNYLQIALRLLARNKSYVIINTLGLGIALACCITAYLLVAFNIEFDSFHDDQKVSNIYKVHSFFREKDGRISQAVTAPSPLAHHAAAELAGIQRFTRFIYGNGSISYGDVAFGEGIAFADSTFFDMFEFPASRGTTASFKDKYTVIITPDIATKYFGTEDPIGKTLNLSFQNDAKADVTVGAVLDKIPANNSFTFRIIMRIENFFEVNSISAENWGDWRDPSTFFTLAGPESAAGISKQLAKYIPVRNLARTDAVAREYKLEPFKAYITEDEVNNSYVNLRISVVPLVIFVSMAAMILLIACFNLTNTSIALTGKRLKEVGVRKAIGASQGQVISQFLFETLLTITLALVAGLLMAQVIVPAFTEMWNLPYGIEDLAGVNFFVALLVIIFVASLLAGMYPAIFNSRFKPVGLLKGQVRVSGTNALTRTLVSLQFAISVVVLIAGAVFIQNNKYQEQIKFGYDKDMLFTISIQSESQFQAMRNVLSRNPKVLATAVCDTHVGAGNYTSPVGIDTGKYESRMVGVGRDYFQAVGFQFTEGRPFDFDNASDRDQAVIVNEAFVEKYNLQGALDKVLVVHDQRRHIVGVVKNHLDNLFRSKEPEPFVFYPQQPKSYSTMLVRAEPGDLLEVQKAAEKVWKDLFPGKPFTSRLQEELVLANIKQTNSNMKRIFLFLTVLGACLSVSGIFSLASLNISRRTKEIGIRKALGATVSSVVNLLNREFIIILTAAALIGSAGGFFLSNLLLNEIYAYHISIGFLPVFLCAAAIFAVGIITTSLTILRAARCNPVDTLRTE